STTIKIIFGLDADGGGVGVLGSAGLEQANCDSDKNKKISNLMIHQILVTWVRFKLVNQFLLCRNGGEKVVRLDVLSLGTQYLDGTFCAQQIVPTLIFKAEFDLPLPFNQRC